MLFLVQLKPITSLIKDHAGESDAGRLAIEQVYGYMCWNSCALGILTTATGFVFLRREDGGILYMSRMYGSHRSLAGFQYVLPQSMAPQSAFTISHMLYWFTAMTERTPPLPETRLQQAVQVEHARRLGSFQPTGTVYAATVPTNYIVPAGTQAPTAGPPGYTGYALEPAADVFLDFKPWLRQNHRGGRAWSGLLLPEKMPVIVKCWDAYKNPVDPCNTEADTYIVLRDLWEICIPKFIAVGKVGFCHAIVLQDLEVMFLWIFIH